jgi:hypothetical protein
MSGYITPTGNIIQHMIIEPLVEHVTICREFANKSDVSLYTRRARITEEKAREDVFIGKLAEFAVYRTTAGCTLPDVNIYENKRKTWAPDLKLEDGTPIHVKAQTIEKAKKYGLSWIFEATDRGVFKNRTGFCAFCISYPNGVIDTAHFVSVQHLHDNNLFKETKLKFKNKLAVYAEDLP